MPRGVKPELIDVMHDQFSSALQDWWRATSVEEIFRGVR